MACLLVPLAEGIVVSAIEKTASHSKNNENGIVKTSGENLSVLKNMLYGGSFLLTIEHIYHGEISFLPPILTAMKTPAEIPGMLYEMATTGVGMALLVTAVWGIGCAVKHFAKKSAGRGGVQCA